MNKSDDDDFTGSRRILAVGAGSGGSSIINSLFHQEIKWVETIAFDTDRKCLDSIYADKRVLIGKSLTKGLGAGGYPDVGKRAAEMARPTIESLLEYADLVFVIAGLGGGTGTGAVPVIADIARDNGAIVIGLVTYPFRIEGKRRQKADGSLGLLRQAAHSVFLFDNQFMNPPGRLNCFGDVFMASRFAVTEAVRCISENICGYSWQRIDYNDVLTIMSKGGLSILMRCEKKLPDTPDDIVRTCLENPVNETDYRTARGCLILFTGGDELTLTFAETVAGSFASHLRTSADVIWGVRHEKMYNGKIRMLSFLTGIQDTENSH